MERAAAMKKLYCDAAEIISPNEPMPLGKSVNINIFVDADHAGDLVTH